MRPIGKIPFRELKSFGIAGLLGEEARVFYNTIFNTRNLGRVNDLLAARLLKSSVDELRLRQLLSLAAFEAYRVQITEVRERRKIAAEKAKAAAFAAGKEYTPKEDDDKLDQPITLECGVDSEKIGVSISMTVPVSVAIDPAALAARINSRQPQGDFERLGVTISDVSDLFVVRWQPEVRRLEFATLLNLGAPAAKQPVELVSVNLEESKRSPRPQEYTEAGDLDYEALLASDTRLQGRKGKGLTAALVKKAKEAAEGDSRVTAGAGEGEDEERLGGGSEEEGGQRIEGQAEEDDLEINMQGEGASGPGSSKRVGGKKGVRGEESTVFDADSEEIAIKKNKVKGKKIVSEDEEHEIEADSGEEGETQIKFKAGEKKASGESDEEDLLIEGDPITVKKKSRLRLRKKAALGEGDDEVEEDSEDEEIVIEGEPGKREKKSKFTFKGGPRDLTEEEEEVVAYGRGGKRLRGDTSDEAEDSEESEEADVAPVKRMKKLMRRIWPFKKKGSAEEEGDGPSGDEETVVVSGSGSGEKEDQSVVRFKGDKDADKAADREYRFKQSEEGGEAQKEGEDESQEQSEAKSDAEKEGSPDGEKTDGASDSDQIMTAFEEKVIGKTVDRVQREAMKLKDEIKDERTKRWVDNLTRDLIAEKSSLRETAKRISANVRQKEFEFKSKQTALEEEVRKRDEQLIQKNHALNRTREQLTQVSRSLDRMKQLSQEAADAASFKQKYALAQKVLQTTKDENGLLQAKIEEMRVQVGQLQLGSGKNKGPSQTEFNVLQSKYDRAFKQIDELRRQNQRMTLEATNRRGIGGNVDAEGLKKKAETSSRMAAIAKKENELLQGRVAKMQRDDKNLRAEILRLQEALRKAGKQTGNAA